MDSRLTKFRLPGTVLIEELRALGYGGGITILKGHMGKVEELGCVSPAQFRVRGLALEENSRLSVFEDGIVDFLSFLEPTSAVNPGSTSVGSNTPYPSASMQDMAKAVLVASSVSKWSICLAALAESASIRSMRSTMRSSP